MKLDIIPDRPVWEDKLPGDVIFFLGAVGLLVARFIDNDNRTIIAVMWPDNVNFEMNWDPPLLDIFDPAQ